MREPDTANATVPIAEVIPIPVKVVTVTWRQLRVLRDLIDDLMSKPSHIRDRAGVMDYSADPDVQDDRGISWGTEEVNFMLPEDQQD